MVWLILIGLLHSAETERSTDLFALYQAGRYEEEILGDIEQAIRLYQQVIEQAPDSRAAALAQVRLGICYEKHGRTGDLDRAEEAYSSVSDAYPDIPSSIAFCCLCLCSRH